MAVSILCWGALVLIMTQCRTYSSAGKSHDFVTSLDNMEAHRYSGRTMYVKKWPLHHLPIL